MGTFLSTQIQWDANDARRRQWSLAAPPGSANEAALYRLYLAVIDAYLESSDTPWKATVASQHARDGDPATVLMDTAFGLKPLRFPCALAPSDVYGSTSGKARFLNLDAQSAYVTKHPPRAVLLHLQHAISGNSTAALKHGNSFVASPSRRQGSGAADELDESARDAKTPDPLDTATEALAATLDTEFFSAFMLDETYRTLHSTTACEPSRLLAEESAKALQEDGRPGSLRRAPVAVESPDQFTLSIWDRRGDGRMHCAAWSLKSLVEYLALVARFHCPDVTFRRVLHSRLAGDAAETDDASSHGRQRGGGGRKGAPRSSETDPVDLSGVLNQQGVVSAVANGDAPPLFLVADTARRTPVLCTPASSAEASARARAAVVGELVAVLGSLSRRADPSDPAGMGPGEAIMTELVYLLNEAPADATDELSPTAWRARAPRHALDALVSRLRLGRTTTISHPAAASGLRLLGEESFDGPGPRAEATEDESGATVQAEAELDVPDVPGLTVAPPQNSSSPVSLRVSRRAGSPEQLAGQRSARGSLGVSDPMWKSASSHGSSPTVVKAVNFSAGDEDLFGPTIRLDDDERPAGGADDALQADGQGIADDRWAAFSPEEITAHIRRTVESETRGEQAPAVDVPDDAMPLWQRASSTATPLSAMVSQGSPLLVRRKSLALMRFAAPAPHTLAAEKGDPTSFRQRSKAESSTLRGAGRDEQAGRDEDVMALVLAPLESGRQLRCLLTVAALGHYDSVLVRSAVRATRRSSRMPVTRVAFEAELAQLHDGSIGVATVRSVPPARPKELGRVCLAIECPRGRRVVTLTARPDGYRLVEDALAGPPPSHGDPVGIDGTPPEARNSCYRTAAEAIAAIVVEDDRRRSLDSRKTTPSGHSLHRSAGAPTPVINSAAASPARELADAVGARTQSMLANNAKTPSVFAGSPKATIGQALDMESLAVTHGSPETTAALSEANSPSSSHFARSTELSGPTPQKANAAASPQPRPPQGGFTVPSSPGVPRQPRPPSVSQSVGQRGAQPRPVAPPQYTPPRVSSSQGRAASARLYASPTEATAAKTSRGRSASRGVAAQGDATPSLSHALLGHATNLHATSSSIASSASPEAIAGIASAPPSRDLGPGTALGPLSAGYVVPGSLVIAPTADGNATPRAATARRTVKVQPAKQPPLFRAVPAIAEAAAAALSLHARVAGRGAAAMLGAIGFVTDPRPSRSVTTSVVIESVSAHAGSSRPTLATYIPGLTMHAPSDPPGAPVLTAPATVTQRLTAFFRGGATNQQLAFDTSSSVKLLYGLAALLDPGHNSALPPEEVARCPQELTERADAKTVSILAQHCCALVAKGAHWRVATSAAAALAACCVAVTHTASGGGVEGIDDLDHLGEFRGSLRRSFASQLVVAATEVRLQTATASFVRACQLADDPKRTSAEAERARRARSPLDDVPIDDIAIHDAARGAGAANAAVFASQSSDYVMPLDTLTSELIECVVPLATLVAESSAVDTAIACHWAVSGVPSSLAAIVARGDLVSHSAAIQAASGALKTLLLRTVADVPLSALSTAVQHSWLVTIDEIASAVTQFFSSPRLISALMLPGASAAAPLPAVLALSAVLLDQSPRLQASCSRSPYSILLRSPVVTGCSRIFSMCAASRIEAAEMTARSNAHREVEADATSTVGEGQGPGLGSSDDDGDDEVDPMLRGDALLRGAAKSGGAASETDEDERDVHAPWEVVYAAAAVLARLPVASSVSRHAARLIVTISRSVAGSGRVLPMSNLDAGQRIPWLQCCVGDAGAAQTVAARGDLHLLALLPLLCHLCERDPGACIGSVPHSGSMGFTQCIEGVLAWLAEIGAPVARAFVAAQKLWLALVAHVQREDCNSTQSVEQGRIRWAIEDDEARDTIVDATQRLLDTSAVAPDKCGSLLACDDVCSTLRAFLAVAGGVEHAAGSLGAEATLFGQPLPGFEASPQRLAAPGPACRGASMIIAADFANGLNLLTHTPKEVPAVAVGRIVDVCVSRIIDGAAAAHFSTTGAALAILSTALRYVHHRVQTAAAGWHEWASIASRHAAGIPKALTDVVRHLPTSTKNSLRMPPLDADARGIAAALVSVTLQLLLVSLAAEHAAALATSRGSVEPDLDEHTASASFAIGLGTSGAELTTTVTAAFVPKSEAHESPLDEGMAAADTSPFAPTSIAKDLVEDHSAILRVAAMQLSDEGRSGATPVLYWALRADALGDQRNGTASPTPSAPSPRRASAHGNTMSDMLRDHAAAAEADARRGTAGAHLGMARAKALLWGTAIPSNPAEWKDDADAADLGLVPMTPCCGSPEASGSPAFLLGTALDLLQLAHDLCPTALGKRRLRVGLNTQYHLDAVLLRLSNGLAAGDIVASVDEREALRSRADLLCRIWRSPAGAGRSSRTASPSLQASPNVNRGLSNASSPRPVYL